tara:strand:- start:260 stop:616 length:357 start_codon:yes stop_codon:yes gene_type:complete
MINEYAEIKDGVVLQVLVKDGTKEEAIQWLKDNVSDNEWVHSVVEDALGKTVATRGGTYNVKLKHFIRKKPFNSWTLDEGRLMYLPPIPKPLAIIIGYVWVWKQKAGEWVSTKIKGLK